MQSTLPTMPDAVISDSISLASGDVLVGTDPVCAGDAGRRSDAQPVDANRDQTIVEDEAGSFALRRRHLQFMQWRRRRVGELL